MELSHGVRSTHVAVFGLGSALSTDDSVGLHVLHALTKQDDFASYVKTLQAEGTDLQWIDAGTVSFPLLATIAQQDAIILVDAARMGRSPGEVGVYEGEALDRYVATSKPSSVHEVSLAELLQAAALTDALPARRALVGIEPQSTALGLEPTPIVQNAIPAACQAVRQLIERWCNE